MGPNTKFLETLQDGKAARIFLPLKGSEERLRVQCIYQSTEAPRFKLLFQASALVGVEIDDSIPSIINFDISGQSVSIEAKIHEFDLPQTLVMIVVKTINHEQLREYFRVDIQTPTVIESLLPAGFGNDDNTWSVPGNTIDLSGSGLLASFKEELPKDQQIRIKVIMPLGSPDIVNAVAHPVRVRKVNEERYDVAFHFDEITIEDRDKVIGRCLTAQRQQLRLKVQVK